MHSLTNNYPIPEKALVPQRKLALAMLMVKWRQTCLPEADLIEPN